MKITFEQVYQNYLGLFLSVFILCPIYTSLSFIPWVFIVVYGVIKGKMKFSIQWVQLSLAALYLTYALWSIDSNHPDIAGKYLEYKLSLIVFPILFLWKIKEGFDFRLLSNYLIGSVLVLTSMNFFHSAFICDQPINCFLASQFSFVHHPTYYSTFVLLAMVAAINGYRNNFRFYSVYIVVPIVLLFVTVSMLTLSLGGILFMLMFWMFFLLHILRKKSKTLFLLGVFSIPLIGYLFLTKVPQVEGEWTSAKFYAKAFLANPKKYISDKTYPFAGSEVRLILWTASVEIIENHPNGVGTGNLDEVIGSKLKGWGQHELAAENYNPHNQFFQTTLELGFLGLFILLGIIIWNGIKAVRNRDLLWICTTALLFFHSNFESMLQRQSGIVFFCFFFCLFSSYSKVSLINKRLDEGQ